VAAVKVAATRLPEVLLLEPRVHADARGYFLETWSEARYRELGIGPFVQDNLSASRRGVLRGLHYQHPQGQGKLVSVLAGDAFDVAVDIRVGSATFGTWVAARLSGDNHRQLWVPAGFAHGFCVLSERALFAYKCTEYYAPQAEGGVRWDDPDLGIAWPLRDPILADKDAGWPPLRDIPEAQLPRIA